MGHVFARAPVRADLAGGTLDLWPLYLFYPGACTVNVAISRFAECEIESIDEPVIEVTLDDEDYHQRYVSVRDMSQDARMALLATALEHFRLTGIRIRIRSAVARGSGLGGSSAMTVAVIAALAEIAETPVEPDLLIDLVRDLETRLIGVPAGVQDYFPAVYGGLETIRLNPGRIERQVIPVPLELLASHLVIHHSGTSHFSGTNNWEIYRKVIDGNKRIRSRLARIASAAVAMESALVAGDFVAAGAALAEEWKHRSQLGKEVSTPEIDQILHVATRAGAWGGKVCGAGGGGAVVLIVDPERRQEVIDALQELPGETLDVQPVAHGLIIDSEAAPRRLEPAVVTGSEEIEHYFAVSGNASAFNPWLAAEIEVTWLEPAGPVHDSARFTLAVPIEEGRLGWDRIVPADLEGFDLRSSPPDDEPFDSRRLEMATEAAARAIDELGDVVQERMKLKVQHNLDLDLLAMADEPAETFLARCRTEANRKFEGELQKLESTFRRRVDQIRERFEQEFHALAETRQIEEGVDLPEPSMTWGQLLHDITSGRTPRIEPTNSPTEADSIAKLIQVHQVWERERAAIGEEIERTAAHNESLVLTPASRDIVIRRPFIVWTDEQPPRGERILNV